MRRGSSKDLLAGFAANPNASSSTPLLCRAIREAVLKQSAEGAEAAAADNQYKGLKAYVDYRAGFRREQTVGSEKGTGAHGPLRGSAYVRTTAR